MPVDDAERALHEAYIALYHLLSERVELTYIHQQKAIVDERIAALRAACGGKTARIAYAKEIGYIEVYG